MKLRALIIDDEPLAHKVILEYAKEVPFLEIVGQCYLATEALAVLKNEAVDLLFLDIQMPKLKGLDFLRTLQVRPIVIITSAYGEYALESYELDVCDYLLKPFRFDRFLKAVNKAFAKHELEHKSGDLSIEAKTSQLLIKSDKRLIPVNTEDVYYLESYGNYVKVWLKDSFHLTPATLSAFETQLPGTHFFRIHKSYVINKKYIAFIEGNTLVLKNDNKLPIGKSQRQAFKIFIS